LSRAPRGAKLREEKMPLDASDLISIEAIVRRVVGVAATPAAPIPRLTVRQFAVAVELSEEVVRRKIRTGLIPRKWVFGCPYKISPLALEQFGVTPQDAHARLAERNLAPSSRLSAA